jgi:hypothetical protein
VRKTDQLKGTLTTLGQSFGETFKQVGQVAAQQGGQLLQQALQQGAQLAAQGAQSKIFVLLGTRCLFFFYLMLLITLVIHSNVFILQPTDKENILLSDRQRKCERPTDKRYY